jgi:small nuclear ribonucleoprotein (snRNP)-like protein
MPAARKPSNGRVTLNIISAQLSEVEKNQIRFEGILESFGIVMNRHLDNTHVDQEMRLRALEGEQNRSYFAKDLLGKLIGYVVTAVIAGGLALLLGKGIG